MKQETEDKIQNIFKLRDKAVAENNKNLFLSTQKNEIIADSAIEGYLKTEKLKSEILHIHNDEGSSNLYICFVKEEYFFDGKYSHTGYLIYTLKEENDSLLIEKIVW